ncbi:MAG: tryptophan synthase subunit alpha [Treponema sp.]|jgi:tryptophan synthase alpha chain|nr:tryptophan synthase subunit alpha [Treponema sp.]
MSRIHSAFGKSKTRPNGKAFIGFVTGGDPSIAKSEEFILEMIRSGADLVEIGIPFSDPIAEGPVIQAANIRALTGGATLEKIFTMVESLRARINAEKLPDIPLVFLSYLNPVFRYGRGNSGESPERIPGENLGKSPAENGYAAFFSRCVSAGVDGIIIPDLPFEEQGEVRGRIPDKAVDIISLVAPTSRDRIREIARASTGFLYLVSSLGVTGIRNNIETDLASMIAEVRKEVSPEKLPAAVGFGVNTPAQAAEIARIADGVIVGSAIVKIIAEYGEKAGPHIAAYVREMKAAVK